MTKMLKLSLLCLALLPSPSRAAEQLQRATFAGGCFWCMQPPFEQLDGVTEVQAGYIGGTAPDPSYDDYAEKGYTEAVQMKYDPAKISYSKLLNVFWRQINPTDPEGQFVDRGPQYRAAIYYKDEKQKALAEKSRDALDKSGRFDKPIVIKIMPVSKFYPAEDYHQDFYKKNPLHYKIYRSGAGRDDYIDQVWGHDPATPTPVAPKPKPEA